MTTIQTRKEQIQKKLNENRTILIAVGAGVAILGATYYKGKHNGETIIELNYCIDPVGHRESKRSIIPQK
ncbi:MAG: hypothetical protein JJE28_08730 [Actinomycetales bacterium]|nr:hypothetical protein [Actinomycetales bacterium]